MRDQRTPARVGFLSDKLQQNRMTANCNTEIPRPVSLQPQVYLRARLHRLGVHQERVVDFVETRMAPLVLADPDQHLLPGLVLERAAQENALTRSKSFDSVFELYCVLQIKLF
jgi:hypothetical protein